MNFEMPGRILAHLTRVAVMILLTGAAHAQSFDCTKARDAVDQAICASPRLRQFDADLARTYTDALTVMPPMPTPYARRSATGRAADQTVCQAALPNRPRPASPILTPPV